VGSDEHGQMSETHPIENLMKTAMQSLEGMVDVNTVVGDAVETKDGTVIVPVSQVSLGFAAGGTEFATAGRRSEDGAFPFGGGSGAGVSVKPVAFLVVHKSGVRLLPVDQRGSLDRLVDLAPDLLDRITNFLEPEDRRKAFSQGDGIFPHPMEAPASPDPLAPPNVVGG